MVVTRDGKSIQLTLEEMRKVYYEVEAMYDMEDVATYAGFNIEDQEELSAFLADTDHMKQIASLYRQYMDENNNWYDNMGYAFDELYTRKEN